MKSAKPPTFTQRLKAGYLKVGITIFIHNMWCIQGLSQTGRYGAIAVLLTLIPTIIKALVSGFIVGVALMIVYVLIVPPILWWSLVGYRQIRYQLQKRFAAPVQLHTRQEENDR